MCSTYLFDSGVFTIVIPSSTLQTDNTKQTKGPATESRPSSAGLSDHSGLETKTTRCPRGELTSWARPCVLSSSGAGRWALYFCSLS